MQAGASQAAVNIRVAHASAGAGHSDARAEPALSVSFGAISVFAAKIRARAGAHDAGVAEALEVPAPGALSVGRALIEAGSGARRANISEAHRVNGTAIAVLTAQIAAGAAEKAAGAHYAFQMTVF